MRLRSGFAATLDGAEAGLVVAIEAGVSIEKEAVPLALEFRGRELFKVCNKTLGFRSKNCGGIKVVEVVTGAFESVKTKLEVLGAMA